MNILLISPQRTITKDQPYSPLGLISIASVLRGNGFNVQIYDRETSSSSIAHIIKSFSPELVGFSAYTGQMLKDAAVVSKYIKSKTNALTVWGGVHPSLLPEQTLENEFVDFVVIGEGEYTTLKLAQKIEEKNNSFSEIPGLGYKIGNKIHINKNTDFIDLSELPMPSWDLLDVKKYYQNWAGCKKLLRIYSSKGCPNRCGFCYNYNYHKSTWRGKSAEKVIEEIKYLVKNYDIDGIGFTDDLFTAKDNRLSRFCELLIENNLKIGWFCNARVGLNEETLLMMKRSGCKCIYFGIETGSKRMLKFINKGIDIPKIKETFAICKQLGIGTVGSFMLGFPTENADDVKQTVSLALELAPTYFDFSLFMCYPGTKLFNFCIENKLFNEPESLEGWIKISSWDIASRNFSDLSNKELQIVCDFFTLKNVINSLRNDRNTLSGYFKIGTFIKAFCDILKLLYKHLSNRSITKQYSLRLFR